MEDLLVVLFLEAYDTSPNEIFLDVGATDDPFHGQQDGRFFHRYCRLNQYCYVPFYIFCNEHQLCASLPQAEQDEAAGSTEQWHTSWSESI